MTPSSKTVIFDGKPFLVFGARFGRADKSSSRATSVCAIIGREIRQAAATNSVFFIFVFRQVLAINIQVRFGAFPKKLYNTQTDRTTS